MKTARPRLKTDTIASIEKKSLLSTGKYTYKARVLSFQHFEYDYIMMRANIARKVWLHVGLECIIIFHYVFISITFPNTIFNKVTLRLSYDQRQIFVSPVFGGFLSKLYPWLCFTFSKICWLYSFGKYIPFYHSMPQNSVISKTLFHLQKS